MDDITWSHDYDSSLRFQQQICIACLSTISACRVLLTVHPAFANLEHSYPIQGVAEKMVHNMNAELTALSSYNRQSLNPT